MEEVDVRLHNDMGSFFASCSELLFRDLAKNQVLLGQVSKEALEVLGSPGALPTRSEVDKAQVKQVFSFHGPDVRGILVLNPGPPGAIFKLSLTLAGELEEAWAKEALSMIHPQLVQSIGTVYGPHEVVEAAALALQKLRPAISWTATMSVTAMELGELPQAPGSLRDPPAGQPHRVIPIRDEHPPEGLCQEVLLAEEAVVEKLTDHYVAFKQDVGLKDPAEPRAAHRMVMEGFIATCEVYVWQVNGEIAAVLAAGRALGHVGRSVQMVYTPPEYRRQGFAAALISHISLALTDRGKRVCLNADPKGEHGATRLYESLGFVNLGLMRQLRFSDTDN